MTIPQPAGPYCCGSCSHLRWPHAHAALALAGPRCRLDLAPEPGYAFCARYSPSEAYPTRPTRKQLLDTLIV